MLLAGRRCDIPVHRPKDAISYGGFRLRYHLSRNLSPARSVSASEGATAVAAPPGGGLGQQHRTPDPRTERECEACRGEIDASF